MHPRLSVSALSSFNLTFDEDLRLWSDLGVEAVGLYLPKLEAAGVDDAVEGIRDRGLAVTSVACRGFELDRPDTWERQRAALEPALVAGAGVHADCVFITSGTPGSLDFDESVDALRRCVDMVRPRADELGVRIAVEHTNPMRRDVGFVHSLADMVEVARALDVGVVVEITNCFFERGIEGTLAHGVDTFSVVQISDYVVGTLTASERAVPGDGAIPLERLMRVIDDAGYRGRFELEMLGPRIEDEGYETAIRRAIAALDPMLP